MGHALAEEVGARVRSAGHPDLRFSHGFVFQHLVPGPASVSEVAEAQGVTTQAISQQVRELEDLGHVERFRDVVAARRARQEVEVTVEDAVGRDRLASATAVLRDVLDALGVTPEIAARRVRRPT